MLAPKNTVLISLLVGLSVLGSGTTCGAKHVQAGSKQTSKAAVPVAPELKAADEKVSQAREQLETAKKQLAAAKALVRAAEADFKAARAAREALSLQLKADSLAGASGLKQLAAQPQGAARSSATLTSAPVPNGQQTPNAPAAGPQLTDFNAADNSQLR